MGSGHEVVLDVPFNKTAAPRESDILMRSEDGQLSPPNLFFDPERWSNAYREQKQSAFIFTPKPWIPLVSIASRIVFFDRFRVAMSGEADRLAKTTHLDVASVIRKLLDKDVCSFECHEILARKRPQLVPFHSDEFRKVLPEEFTRQNQEFHGVSNHLATNHLWNRKRGTQVVTPFPRGLDFP